MKGLNYHVIRVTILFLHVIFAVSNLAYGRSSDTGPFESNLPQTDAEISKSHSDLVAGEFQLRLRDGKVYLHANHADAYEMLSALAKTADIELDCEEPLIETRSIVLEGTSIEKAIRLIATNYLLEFAKSRDNGELKLTYVNAVARETDEIAYLAKAFSVHKNLYRGNEVHEGLTRKAVLHEVQQVYGKARIAKTFTYYSIDNKPEAYCYILYLKDGGLPDVDERLAEIAKKEQEINTLKAVISKLKDPEKKATKIRKLGNINAELVAGYGRQSFVTAIGGAHEGHVPVLAMVDGLPVDLALIPELSRRLRSEYGEDNVKFLRTIYTGMFNVMHEFDIGTGEPILVHPRTGQEIDKRLVLHDAIVEYKEQSKKLETDSAAREALEKHKKKKQKKWEYVRNLKE